jgi:hypothetical protein
LDHAAKLGIASVLTGPNALLALVLFQQRLD